MKVFVWVGYCIANVYDADTVESIEYVWSLLSDSIEYNASEEDLIELEKCVAYIGNQIDEPLRYNAYVRSINKMLKRFVGYIDGFEYGTGLQDLKRKPQ